MAQEGRKTGSSLLWSLSIGHLFTHWYPGTFYILLPFIVKEFGLSYTEAGFLISFRAMVKVVTNIPSGIIVDVIGNKGFLLALSLVWAGIPYFLMGFAQQYFWLLITMALVGMGNELWHPSALSLLALKYPQRKGWAIGVHSMAANLGDALSPLLVGLLLTFAGWRTIVFYNVIPGLLVAVLIWLLFSSDKREAARQVPAGKVKDALTLRGYWQQIKLLLRSPGLIWPVLISAFRAMAQNGVRTFIPLFLANYMALSASLTGLYLTAIQVAGLVAGPASGTLSDRLGRKRVLMYGLLGTALVLLSLVFFHNEIWLVFILAFLGFFIYSLRPVLFAWALDTTPPEMGGTVTSILFGTQSLFSSISPIIGGFIADRWGIIYTFYFMAVVILIASIIVVFVPEGKCEKISATL